MAPWFRLFAQPLVRFLLLSSDASQSEGGATLETQAEGGLRESAPVGWVGPHGGARPRRRPPPVYIRDFLLVSRISLYLE